MAVFVDFDFQEVADVKKRRERAGPDAAALAPQFARLVAQLGEKRDTRFLRALAHVAHLHRAFFEISWKLSGTLNNKMTDLEAQLGALDSGSDGNSSNSDRPVKEGIVYKRGGERLFFVLRGGTLHMLREGRDYAPDSELDMMTTSVKVPQVADDDDWRDHYRFELNSLRLVRPVVVYTTTAAERAEWVKVLQDAIASKINSLSIAGDVSSSDAPNSASVSSAALSSSADSLPSSLPSSSSSSFPSSASTAATATSASGGDETEGGGGDARKQELHGSALSEAAIAAVRACGGNGVCAECGAADPEWAVLNFGILICLECSGVHRSLGTHISKVRSLALDRWTPEAVLLLTHLGNTRHNAVYEEALASASTTSTDDGSTASDTANASASTAPARPHATSTRAVREAFIRAKYQERRFVRRVADTQAACDAALLHAVGDADAVRGAAAAVHALASGADANCVDPADRSTPLHRAIAAGSLLALELLVQNGASAARTDARGWSPLHYAAFYNRPRCALRLLQCARASAGASASSSGAPSALELARWNAAPEAASVLAGTPAGLELTVDIAASPAPDAAADSAPTPPRTTALPTPDAAAALLQAEPTVPLPAAAHPVPSRAVPPPPSPSPLPSPSPQSQSQTGDAPAPAAPVLPSSPPSPPPQSSSPSSPSSPSSASSPPLKPAGTSLPPSPVAPGLKMLAVPAGPGKHQLKRTRAPGSPQVERRAPTGGTGGSEAARDPPRGGVAVLPACPQAQRPWGAPRPAPASAGPVRRATVSKPQPPQPPGAGTPLQQRRLSQQLSRPASDAVPPKPLPAKPLPAPQRQSPVPPRTRPASATPEHEHEQVAAAEPVHAAAAPVAAAAVAAPAAPQDETPSVSMELDALASFLAESSSSSSSLPQSGTAAAAAAAAGTGTQGASATTDMLSELNTGQDTDAQLADFNMALQSIDDVLGNLQTLKFD